MPTTTNIKLDIPAHGSNVDVWDTTPINNNSAILDLAFGGVTTKSLSANIVLTDTEARASILRFTGALGGAVGVNVGAIRKSWIVENLCTGASAAVVLTGGSGNVVGVPPGASQVYWDGTNCGFINIGRVGEFWDYAGSAVPTWLTFCTVPPALACIGGTFSAVTYPLLNAILGTTTLPDSRGRARIALNGGTGRVTSAGSGIDGDTRSAAGGAQNVALTTAQLAAHSHGVNDPGHPHSVTGGIFGGTNNATLFGGTPGSGPSTSSNVTIASNTTGISIQNAGSGDAHNNMPPAYVSGITMIWAA